MQWPVDFFHQLVLAFIPLFVAIDAIGVLPFVLALTQNIEPRERVLSIRYAMLTALALGIGFIVIGKFVFSVLGITSEDFLIAGGLLLLVFSIKDIATGKFIEYQIGAGGHTLGVVPIGTPLVVGPAVLTTLLLLVGRYHYLVVLVAFVLNLILTWIIFAQANRISKFLGMAGQRATSKIASLLLAAIAVKMIRQGIIGVLKM